MDRKSSPERSSTDPPDMATMVIPHSLHSQPSGVNKRYRPIPAKTFQCRGFGDCRMVFSRSEHLARHIRKHTGERPFGCHCGKQFSRLDNLRQHAQTVHADKQEQNEAMMRHLTSLHASMAAANKVGQSRGGRRPNASPTNASALSNGNSSGAPINVVKQEDFTVKMSQRPGTSTGYEGDHNGLLYHQGPAWHISQTDSEGPDARPSNNHSFRDPGQSFLAPAAAAAPFHSFLAFSPTFNFGLPDPTRGDIRPGSSSSRPPTGNLTNSTARSLPPLSAVVSASLSSPSQQQQSFFSPSSSQQQQQSAQSILSLPAPYSLRRPTTATRPGTAPASASFFSSKPSLFGGPGLASRAELQFSYGRFNSELGANYDAEPASPIAGHDSPFFFQPRQSHSAILTSPTSPVVNPRKRTFGGPDGPRDDTDNGSESRPQSRRLTVLELCNDDDRPHTATGPLLLSQPCPPLSAGISPRPDTSSSALISSASALAIVDPVSPASASGGGDSPLLAGTPSSPGCTVAPSRSGDSYANRSRGGGKSSQERGRNTLSPSSSPATAAAVRFDIPRTTTILHNRSGSGGPTGFARSTTVSSTPSSSPSIGSRSPPAGFSRNAISSTDTSSPLSRRSHGAGDTKHDQVRIAVSPHPSTAVGMRV